MTDDGTKNVFSLATFGIVKNITYLCETLNNKWLWNFGGTLWIYTFR